MNPGSFKLQPSHWGIFDPEFDPESEQDSPRCIAHIFPNESSATNRIKQAKIDGMEVRTYFRDLTSEGLSIRTRIIFTNSPAENVQGFHSHRGTCLEFICVARGKLVAIESDTITRSELFELILSRNMASLQGLGQVLYPGQMYQTDHTTRHTLVTVVASTFWTWQIPIPQPGAPLFSPECMSM